MCTSLKSKYQQDPATITTMSPKSLDIWIARRSAGPSSSSPLCSDSTLPGARPPTSIQSRLLTWMQTVTQLLQSRMNLNYELLERTELLCPLAMHAPSQTISPSLLSCVQRMQTRFLSPCARFQSTITQPFTLVMTHLYGG